MQDKTLAFRLTSLSFQVFLKSQPFQFNEIYHDAP